MQDRTYLAYYGHIGQRFCVLNPTYVDLYSKLFEQQYEVVYRLEQAKLRNLACFFAHLFYTNALDWKVLNCIQLTEDLTTASSRIFIKILLQEMANNMGISVFAQKMDAIECDSLFPQDSVENARFSINFFTSIGLGVVTEKLREFLKDAPKLLLQKKYNELLQ